MGFLLTRRRTTTNERVKKRDQFKSSTFCSVFRILQLCIKGHRRPKKKKKCTEMDGWIRVNDGESAYQF